jgi:hypothetical protein
MKMRRTLLTAGVFALLAMIYVPTPAKPYHAAHYRFVFSQGDTSVAFFQLLVNVVFAALLGAILATIIPKLPRWAWRWITGIAVIALLCIGGVAWRNFTAAAADRARFDEEFADSQLAYHYPDAAKFTLRSAARNWRLALRFDEATRVENRIKKMGSNFDPDAFIASHGQSVSTPLPSPDRAAKDLGLVPDAPTQAPHDWQNDPVVDLSGLPDQAPAQAPEASAQGNPVPTPTKYISTNPNAGEPIPRARPVRSPSPR